MKYENMAEVPDEVLIEANKCCRKDITQEEVSAYLCGGDTNEYCIKVHCPLCEMKECACGEEIAKRFERLLKLKALAIRSINDSVNELCRIKNDLNWLKELQEAKDETYNV